MPTVFEYPEIIGTIRQEVIEVLLAEYSHEFAVIKLLNSDIPAYATCCKDFIKILIYDVYHDVTAAIIVDVECNKWKLHYTDQKESKEKISPDCLTQFVPLPGECDFEALSPECHIPWSLPIPDECRCPSLTAALPITPLYSQRSPQIMIEASQTLKGSMPQSSLNPINLFEDRECTEQFKPAPLRVTSIRLPEERISKLNLR